MDDFVASVESVGLAKEVQKQLTEIGNKAGFHMLKLISQKSEVIEDVPVTDWAAEDHLEKKEFPITKALEVVQIGQAEKFSFCFQPTTWGTPITKTERAEENCNNLIWSIWIPDPLYQQKCWCKRVMKALGWDEELLNYLKADWKERCLKEGRRFAMLPYAYTPLVTILRKPTLP